MNLVQLKIQYVDHLTHTRTIIRPITEEISNEWIDGWFSAMSEMISFRGGRITYFLREVMPEIKK